MFSNTSSTNRNVGASFMFLHGCQGPKLQRRLGVGTLGPRPPAETELPTLEEIERLTKQIVEEILRGLPEPDPDPPDP